LPDWDSNGAKNITNLVYPFNLNTSGALKELANIPASKMNQAQLTINVWAFTKDGGFTDLCNRHRFTNKGETTPSTEPPKPKEATNCSSICTKSPDIEFGFTRAGSTQFTY